MTIKNQSLYLKRFGIGMDLQEALILACSIWMFYHTPLVSYPECTPGLPFSHSNLRLLSNGTLSLLGESCVPRTPTSPPLCTVSTSSSSSSSVKVVKNWHRRLCNTLEPCASRIVCKFWHQWQCRKCWFLKSWVWDQIAIYNFTINDCSSAHNLHLRNDLGSWWFF